VDFKIAWRNVWRNPRRSILTVCAIAFACTLLVFMLSWQFGSYQTMINAAVKINTGHLQVQAEGYNEKRSIRLVVPEPSLVAALLDRIPRVAGYTFRGNAFSLISSKERTYGGLVVGIDPSREAKVSTLVRIIRQGDYLSPDDTDQALIGAILAENLRVGIGDEVVLLGQGRDGSVAATVVHVKGIFSSGMDELDRSSIRIPLRYFQSTYAMGEAVHEVVVLGQSLTHVENIKREVEAGLGNLRKTDHLVVLDWMELLPGLVQSIQMDLVSGFIFYLILIVVVAFSILNTFLMVVFERTREFGVLLAVGTSPGRLTKLLLLESSTIAFLGMIIGVIAGSLVTLYFQTHGILISGATEILRQFGLPERMFPRLSALSIMIGTGIVLFITLLTALYPALKVRRLHPVKAMTSG